MKRSISQESMNSGRRTPDGVTQRPAFLRSLSIEPDSPGPGTFGDDTAEALLGAGSAVKSYLGLLLFHVEAFFPKSKTCATSLSADQGHHNVVAFSKLPREPVHKSNCRGVSRRDVGHVAPDSLVDLRTGANSFASPPTTRVRCLSRAKRNSRRRRLKRRTATSSTRRASACPWSSSTRRSTS